MARPLLPHLPLDPLFRRVQWEHHRLDADTSWSDGRDLLYVTEVAQILGVTRRSLHRWMHDGIPLHTADLLAKRLGYHPVDVWPDWYELPLADVS